MTVEHAEFVVSLRSDPAVGRFLNAGAQTPLEQAQWIEAQAACKQDHNFIVQRAGQPIGTAALLNADPRGEAEYGRFALLPNSARLLALPAHWLVLRYGFEQLGLTAICWEVREDNEKVLAFHEAFGYVSRSYVSSQDGLPEGTGLWRYRLEPVCFEQLSRHHQPVLQSLLGEPFNS